MTSKELIFWNFKERGGFKEYKNFEEYQNRDKKKEAPKIMKSKALIKAEEIQHLKAAYDPPPRDPKELKKYNERKRLRPIKEIKNIEF